MDNTLSRRHNRPGPDAAEARKDEEAGSMRRGPPFSFRGKCCALSPSLGQTRAALGWSEGAESAGSGPSSVNPAEEPPEGGRVNRVEGPTLSADGIPYRAPMRRRPG